MDEEIKISIKCEQGDIKRRFRLRGRNYTDLYANLTAQFSSGFNIFWKDDENDLIVINSPESLEEAHTESPTGNLIRVVVKEQRTPVHNKEILVQTEPVIEQKLNEMNQQPIPPSSRTEGVVHDACCDICDATIIGHRFKCLVCPNYDLCASCESTGAHANHAMMRTINADSLIPYGIPGANSQPKKTWTLPPPKSSWNSPSKSADEKLKEFTMNGLSLLASVGSAVTDTLSNFGIDATYEVRGDGGRTTGRKGPVPAPAPPTKTEAKEEDKEKKDDKKEAPENGKDEEKKAEPVKEKEAEKVEEKKPEPFNPFTNSGLLSMPPEKKATKASETPVVTREQAKLNGKTEISRKKITTRLQDEVAKAKKEKEMKKLRDLAARDRDSEDDFADRRERAFGSGDYREYDDSDYRGAPRQTKRPSRKREDTFGNRPFDLAGDFVHGPQCVCTACTHGLGFGGRRIGFGGGGFGSGGFGSMRFGGTGFINREFGTRGFEPAPPPRDFPIPPADFGESRFDPVPPPPPRGFGPVTPDFGKRSSVGRDFGRSRSPTLNSRCMFDCDWEDGDNFKNKEKKRRASQQSAFARGNPNFGKSPESQFGEPCYVEDEEALRAKKDSIYVNEKTPTAFDARYVSADDKDEKKEPLKEVEEAKTIATSSVHASVLIPLLEEIGERVNNTIEQERQADFFVDRNGQTYIGDGKMTCDEAMGASETYENKSTDEESIGSEVVAVEDVDSDGWVDAKDSDEFIAKLTMANLPTAPVDDTPANQLNVDGTFATLLSMGYSDQQARRAISHCGCDLENCIDYISQQ